MIHRRKKNKQKKTTCFGEEKQEKNDKKNVIKLFLLKRKKKQGFLFNSCFDANVKNMKLNTFCGVLLYKNYIELLYILDYSLFI